MTGFATPDILATVMRREFTPDELAWVDTLLSQSADYLRNIVLGQHVYPEKTSTITVYPAGGSFDLPQSFIRSVDSVVRDGNPVQFKQFEDSVLIDGDDACDVTFTYGASIAPGDLQAINCALVSSAIMLVESKIGLTAGGLSSIALDDFKIAFADGGGLTGLTALPELTARNLRAAYGRTAWTVQTRR